MPSHIGNTLIEAFLAHAAHHPGRLALSDEDGPQWTYAELRRRVTATARVLAERGVRPGGRVAVVGGRTADTVTALLAVLCAGGTYSVLDPALPQARQEVVLADLEPDALLATIDPRPQGAPVVRLGEVAPVDGKHVADGRAGDLAYVMYTSGSTGRPKGVLVEHGSVLNMLRSFDLLAPPRKQIVGSLVAPLGFDVSVWEIFSVLTRGGTLHVPTRERLQDGAALWRFLADTGVTSAYVPPGLLASVVGTAERDGARAALDRVLVGVEPIPQGLLDRFRTAVPGLRVVNGYGPTETTITATLHLLGAVQDPARRTPIGRPVLGSTIELLDEHLQLVPDGEPGEVVVFGDCLARGYHGGVAGGFVTLPAGRAYRTGDYARRLPDGALEFVGRRDGQVKINGFRVELGEIESVLTRAPGVRHCVVLVSGDSGARRLVAAAEADADDGSLREYLADRLPAHMVPSRVVVVPAFPLTGNGKVDSVALLAMGRERPADAPPFVPPGTEDQRRVARAWVEVLGVAEVGLDDDFHWLGGTSLDAVRIATRLTERGHPVATPAVLTARTVRALCTLGSTPLPASAPAAPGVHPASRAHQGLWAWRQLTPGDSASTVVHAIRLDRTVDPERLHSALTAVVARHEALRTTFHATADGQVRQHVSAPGPVELPVRQEASESTVDERLLALLGHRFDVTDRPWTAELVVGDDFAALVFAADHLVFDGESAAILERDLLRAYEGGEAPAVPGPASAAALAAATPGRAAALREYWRTALADLTEVPALPERLELHPAAAQRNRVERTLSADTWDAVTALARREGTTPFVVVLAAFKAFLRRRANHEDNTVAIAVSRRHAVGCPEAIGHFVNLVPVRDRVPATEQPFRQYLRTVAATLRDCMAHAELPFEDMIADLPRPVAASTIAAPARVALVQRPQGAHSWPRVPANALYDLTAFLDEGDGDRPARLEWVWNAATALEGAAAFAATAFDLFLAEVAGRPGTALADAPVLAPEERELILGNVRDDGRQYPTLVELLSEQVRRRPDAITVQQGDTCVSYAELDRQAAQIQALLPAVTPGQPVVVVLNKSIDLVAVLVAVLRAGAAYLPLDPGHARTRLADLARRCGAGACVTRSGLLTDDPGVPLVLLDRPAPQADPAPAAVGPDDPAYVMPTSGTTGMPKIVGVPHRAVARLVHRSSALPLDHTDRTLLVSNTSFDAATFEIWGALANGGRIVVPEPGELREPELLCRAIERHGITAGFFTVAIFERLVEAEPARLAGMRHVIVGGEAVPPRLFAEAAQHLPRSALVNGYGPTENTTFSCCYRLDRDAAMLRSVPIGPPIPGSGAFIADESLRPLPVGVPGEILVSGHGLAHGYLDDPELTVGRFVHPELLDGRSAYRTGDLGRLLPDGTFEYLGRLDRQLKVRGFRIEPAEVELALERHPGARRAVAYAERVAGMLSLRAAVEATDVDAGELRRWLAGHLPEFMLPDRICVVETFPINANNKLDHAALRALDESRRNQTRDEPSTKLERDLTRIWTEVLDTPGIGLDDDVFSLGANSMTVLAVTARVKRELGWAVPAHLVYSVRTIRGLAAQGNAPNDTRDQELRLRVGRRSELARKSIRSRRARP